MGFDRRRRLWETFGPEAFADPPITEPEEGSTLTGVVVLGLLVAVAFIPFLMWFSRVVFEYVELGFVLFGWLLILVAVLWLLTVRRKERFTRPDSEQNRDDAPTSQKCP